MREAISGSSAGDEDAALAARARLGDGAAFEELYRRHRDRVYTLCLNLCGNQEDARDLLQEAFVRAWRGLPGFSGRSAFMTWLYRIAVNVCREARRRRRPADNCLAPAPGADHGMAEHVRWALSRLRPTHRLVLVLRYTLSLSHREIGEQLNWTIPRVKVTLHRAKRAFKNAYLQADEP